MGLVEKLEKWIHAYDQNGYLNGSILVASKGNILLNKGFGMANFEHQIPNHPKTKFRIGSLTKAFTALSIFQLQEQQKLHIDDYINKYLPDYPKGDQITIYHCLTCTAGIPNYTSFPDFWFQTMRLPSTLEQLIDSFKDLELEFDPGSAFEYSSSGYALLTAIIEKVSGLTYAEYIQEYICQPLGMVNTGCDDGVKIVPNLASGYSFWEKPIHSAYADMSFPLGGYGLYSTTEDLLLWDQALGSPSLLSTDSMKKMFRPYLDSYACGWMVSNILDRRCIHHFGDISGYFSDFLRFVDEEVTIIFLSNMNVTPVTHLTKEMARIVFGEEVDYPVPALPIQLQESDRLAGQYALTANKTLEISLDDGDLYVTVPKMYGVPYKFKLVPIRQESNQITFITEMIHETVTIHLSDLGQVDSITYTDFYGETICGEKISSLTPY